MRVVVAFACLFFPLNQAVFGQSLAESLDAMFLEFPLLKAGQANTQIRQEIVEIERSEWKPQIGVSLIGGRERFRKTPTRFAITDTGTASIDGRQLLYDGGYTKSRVTGAQALAHLSESQLEASRQGLALELATAYINILKYRNLIRLAEENISIHRGALDKTTQKFDSGAAPEADVSLVQARLSMAEATLEGRRRQLSHAVESYRYFTAIDPGELKEPAFPEWALPSSPDDADFSRNPDIRSARFNVEASEAQVREAESAYKPRFNFYLQSDSIDSARYANRQGDSSALVVMTYDIFNGGRRNADKQRALSLADKTAFELEDMRYEVKTGFAQAWNDLAIAEDRLVQLKSYQGSLNSVVSAYERQFELGQRALINVLDVQNELYAAKSSVAEEQYNRLISAYRILASTGSLIETIH